MISLSTFYIIKYVLILLRLAFHLAPLMPSSKWKDKHHALTQRFRRICYDRLPLRPEIISAGIVAYVPAFGFLLFLDIILSNGARRLHGIRATWTLAWGTLSLLTVLRLWWACCVAYKALRLKYVYRRSQIVKGVRLVLLSCLQWIVTLILMMIALFATVGNRQRLVLLLVLVVVFHILLVQDLVWFGFLVKRLSSSKRQNRPDVDLTGASATREPGTPDLEDPERPVLNANAASLPQSVRWTWLIPCLAICLLLELLFILQDQKKWEGFDWIPGPLYLLLGIFFVLFAWGSRTLVFASRQQEDSTVRSAHCAVITGEVGLLSTAAYAILKMDPYREGEEEIVLKQYLRNAMIFQYAATLFYLVEALSWTCFLCYKHIRRNRIEKVGLQQVQAHTQAPGQNQGQGQDQAIPALDGAADLPPKRLFRQSMMKLVAATREANKQHMMSQNEKECALATFSLTILLAIFFYLILLATRGIRGNHTAGIGLIIAIVALALFITCFCIFGLHRCQKLGHPKEHLLAQRRFRHAAVLATDRERIPATEMFTFERRNTFSTPRSHYLAPISSSEAAEPVRAASAPNTRRSSRATAAASRAATREPTSLGIGRTDTFAADEIYKARRLAEKNKAAAAAAKSRRNTFAFRPKETPSNVAEPRDQSSKAAEPAPEVKRKPTVTFALDGQTSPRKEERESEWETTVSESSNSSLAKRKSALRSGPRIDGVMSLDGPSAAAPEEQLAERIERALSLRGVGVSLVADGTRTIRPPFKPRGGVLSIVEEEGKGRGSGSLESGAATGGEDIELADRNGPAA